MCTVLDVTTGALSLFCRQGMKWGSWGDLDLSLFGVWEQGVLRPATVYQIVGGVSPDIGLSGGQDGGLLFP